MHLDLPSSLPSHRRSLLEAAAAQLEAEHGGELLGLVLSGSAGRGLDTEYSDMDVLVVLEPDIVNGPRAPRVHTAELELIPMTLDHLETIAAVDSPEWGYRWSYAWAPVLADLTGGRVAAAIERQTHLTADETRSILAGWRLDAWINLVYRTLKSVRDGNTLAASLDAAESIPLFLDIVFALDGQVRPYNKYLRWTLRNHPLPSWPADELLAVIDQMRAADPQTFRDTLRRLQEAATSFDESIIDSVRAVFDGWAPTEYDVLRKPA